MAVYETQANEERGTAETAEIPTDGSEHARDSLIAQAHSNVTQDSLDSHSHSDH